MSKEKYNYHQGLEQAYNQQHGIHSPDDSKYTIADDKESLKSEYADICKKNPFGILLDENIISDDDLFNCNKVYVELIEPESNTENKLPIFPINYNEFVDLIKNKLNNDKEVDENIKNR